MCLIVRRVVCQDDGFKIYPNSTNGVVNIEYGGRCVDSLMVEVIDVYGKVVVSDQMSGSYHIMNIDSLEDGMYFFRFSVPGCSEDIMIYGVIKRVSVKQTGTTIR